jgi:hypothetical protein
VATHGYGCNSYPLSAVRARTYVCRKRACVCDRTHPMPSLCLSLFLSRRTFKAHERAECVHKACVAWRSVIISKDGTVRALSVAHIHHPHLTHTHTHTHTQGHLQGQRHSHTDKHTLACGSCPSLPMLCVDHVCLVKVNGRDAVQVRDGACSLLVRTQRHRYEVRKGCSPAQTARSASISATCTYEASSCACASICVWMCAWWPRGERRVPGYMCSCRN